MHILIVDDDPRLRSTLALGLAHAGHDAQAAADAEEAEDALRGASFDLVLLDVMMPGRDGWQLLEDLRASGIDVPVIFLTARDAIDERVRGLRAGADDYLAKPFALEELIARIDAVARRHAELPIVERGPLRLDPGRRQCELDGQRIELSPREFELLLALARADGAPVDRKHLLSEVWGIEFEPETNTVEVHIGRLRKRFGSRGKQLIRTEVGVGYRLDPQNAS